MKEAKWKKTRKEKLDKCWWGLFGKKNGSEFTETKPNRTEIDKITEWILNLRTEKKWFVSNRNKTKSKTEWISEIYEIELYI